MIVGAGPVGLLLANFLGQRGIRCLLIEKRAQTIDWSRAIGITPPSLEILRLAGLHCEMTNQGVKVQEAVVHDDRGRAGSLSFNQIPSRYRFILTLPQSKTMKTLEEALQRHPSVTFQRGTELIKLQSGEQHVRAKLKDITGNNRTETVNAQWLVGTDGADSPTRKMMGIHFKRRPYGLSFVMADYEDTTGWGDEAHLFFTQHGSLESFPLPDKKRRWIALLDGENNAKTDKGWLEQQTLLLSGKDIAGLRCSPIFYFEPEKISVSRLWADRTILAGDAAHVMSPIGGQGMNTGFADAEFLASLLPELLNRSESEHEEILNNYDFRRRRAARSARRRSALGMWVGTRTGARASTIRSVLLRRILLKSPLREKLAPHFAMLNIPFNRLNRPHAGFIN